MKKQTSTAKCSDQLMRERRPAVPTLRFSPTAWAKMLFLRDSGDTEVGGFGIAAEDDLLFLENVQLVKQSCSWAHVAFDDNSVADFFDELVDRGRRPEQFARVWLHTHPGECPLPSMTDEETFARAFGSEDWAIMFILAREGQSFARLGFHVGPHAQLEIPVAVDYSRAFDACDHDAWEREYVECVHVQELTSSRQISPSHAPPFDETPADDWYDSWFDYTHEPEELEEFVS